ncbi:MAG: cysteine hydrolase, partial [Planctomycetes bacterium]|nr:cysteine hydrolase [Planctomycetota bacterium]
MNEMESSKVNPLDSNGILKIIREAITAAYRAKDDRPSSKAILAFAVRLAGSWGSQIVPALEPHPDEYRVAKRRYSGFFETDLDLRLRELGIRHVVVVGVVTNICVRSTVHDAFYRGYDAIVPRECVMA